MNAMNLSSLGETESFTFNDHTLRTMKIDGEPWMVAVDVLRALGVSVTKGTIQALRPLDANEKHIAAVPPVNFTGQVGQGTRNTALISESGFYKITMRAQRTNPAAREFQDWVTKVVLPFVRLAPTS